MADAEAESKFLVEELSTQLKKKTEEAALIYQASGGVMRMEEYAKSPSPEARPSGEPTRPDRLLSPPSSPRKGAPSLPPRPPAGGPNRNPDSSKPASVRVPTSGAAVESKGTSATSSTTASTASSTAGSGAKGPSTTMSSAEWVRSAAASGRQAAARKFLTGVSREPTPEPTSPGVDPGPDADVQGAGGAEEAHTQSSPEDQTEKGRRDSRSFSAPFSPLYAKVELDQLDLSGSDIGSSDASAGGTRGRRRKLRVSRTEEDVSKENTKFLGLF